MILSLVYYKCQFGYFIYLFSIYLIFMPVARHSRPENHSKVWATNQQLFKGPLLPTPRAETGLRPLESIQM